MITARITGFFHKAFRLVFFDEVRLIELFSALNLMAWVILLYETPMLFERDSYRAFDALSQTTWMVAFALISMCQLSGIFLRWSHAHELRFAGLAMASGAWATVAVSFIVSNVSTTAEANYILLATACMISGAFVGWRKS